MPSKQHTLYGNKKREETTYHNLKISETKKTSTPFMCFKTRRYPGENESI
jgi:hypothetical protein